jgi:hypothetical protein
VAHAKPGLEDRPFAWIAEGGDIQISHRAKPVIRLRGEAAARFLARVEGLDAEHSSSWRA